MIYYKLLMEEFMSLVTRSQLIKLSIIAIGCIVGGIILLVLKSLNFWPGLIIGGIITFIGLIIILSKKDRFVGLVTFGAGAVIVLSVIPGLGSLADILMSLSGWILIIAGAVAVFFLIRAMQKRT
jgi:hypothetical protein